MLYHIVIHIISCHIYSMLIEFCYLYCNFQILLPYSENNLHLLPYTFNSNKNNR